MWLFHYIAPFFLQYRLRKGKEDPQRYQEKLGLYKNFDRSKEKIYIHIHGASVGETLSALPIITSLSQSYTNIFFIITSHTLTSAAVMSKKLPENAIHVFAPLDTPQATQRFYSHFKPHISLILDSELWPNLMLQAHKDKISVYGINTRLSQKSLKLWRNIPKLLRKILSSYNGFFVQNQEIYDFISKYYQGNVQIIPNLKWATRPHIKDQSLEPLLKAIFRNRYIISLQSTHPEEEIDIITALYHKNFFQEPQNCLIIIPRHPFRKNQILQAIQKKFSNLIVACRTDKQTPPLNIQIYIADTIGETVKWLHISNLVFIGNSLNFTTKGGGHNPIEAAYLKKPILTGPKIQNFTEIYALLKQNNGCIIAQNAQDLVHKICLLRQNPHLVQKLKASGYQLCEANYKNSLSFLHVIHQKIYEIIHHAST